MLTQINGKDGISSLHVIFAEVTKTSLGHQHNRKHIQTVLR